MSTIKVANIQHPDAASPAITLDSSGNASIPSLPKILTASLSAASGENIVVFSEAFSQTPFVAVAPESHGGGLFPTVSAPYDVTTTGFKFKVWITYNNDTWSEGAQNPTRWVAIGQ